MTNREAAEELVAMETWGVPPGQHDAVLGRQIARAYLEALELIATLRKGLVDGEPDYPEPTLIAKVDEFLGEQ